MKDTPTRGSNPSAPTTEAQNMRADVALLDFSFSCPRGLMTDDKKKIETSEAASQVVPLFQRLTEATKGSAAPHPSDGFIDDKGQRDQDLGGPTFEDRDFPEGFEEVFGPQAERWEKRYPASTICPVRVARRITFDAQRRNLLWNQEDIEAACDQSEFMLDMLGLGHVDDDLYHALSAAFEAMWELHAWGRTTSAGLAIGTLQIFLQNSPAFRKYFTKPAP